MVDFVIIFALLLMTKISIIETKLLETPDYCFSIDYDVRLILLNELKHVNELLSHRKRYDLLP